MGRQKDNPATTNVDESAVVSLPIDLANGKIGTVYFTRGQATYFGIVLDSTTTTTPGYKRVKRKAYSRSDYDGVWDTTATTRQVAASDFYIPTEVGGRHAPGKAVYVPLKIRPGTKTTGPFRTTTFRVQGNANLAVISDWLATNLKTNTPSWFEREGANKHVVAPKGSITDLNPGRNTVAIQPV